MDAFEQVVSEVLWMEGYWVRSSARVELTKEEKRAINRHSSPPLGDRHRWLQGWREPPSRRRVQELPRLDGRKGSGFRRQQRRRSQTVQTLQRGGPARRCVQASSLAACSLRRLPSGPKDQAYACLRQYP